MFQETDPHICFCNDFGKCTPIIVIFFSPLQQEIYDAQKLSYFSHLTCIMLPLCLAKQTLMLVSMRIFLDHATKQISMHSNGWLKYLFTYLQQCFVVTGKESVAWYLSKMSPKQMDISTGCCTGAHSTYVIPQII